MLGFKCRCVLLIYDGQLHSVGSPISGLKHDQLAVRFHRFASKAVGAGFDADCVLSLTHHAPFDVARHGAGIIGDADAGASETASYCRWRPPLRRWHWAPCGVRRFAASNSAGGK